MINRELSQQSNILLPPYEAEQYLAAPVQFLEAGAIPTYTGDKAPNTLTHRGQLEAQLGRITTSQADGFLITDKNIPHAAREVMWIDGRNIPVATVSEAPIALNAVLREARLFMEYSASERLYPTFSWSHDPLTNHRVSIQGEKRLHMHGIARKPEELSAAQESKTLLGEVGFVTRRRIVDEFAIIGKHIGAELASGENLEVVDLHPGLLSLRLPSIESLGDATYTPKLINLFDKLQQYYDHVIYHLGGENDFGMLNLDVVDKRVADIVADMEPSTAQLLTYFLNGLRPVDDEIVERFTRPRLKHYGKTFIPLKGLAYSVCISSVADDTYMHLRFSKFADMGGAGCTIIEGIPTRVQRGLRMMSNEELQARRDFQQSFKLQLATAEMAGAEHA